MLLYCATKNPGKLREFMEIAGEVETLPDLDRIVPPEETGDTFEQNAADKARFYSRYCEGLLFVDDSGIELDALDGAPGIYSARFAGPNAADEANNELLLERMRGETNRHARYICVVALASRGELLETFRGEVEGELLEGPLGTNGFGYDPLFYYPPFGKTFGEASSEEKRRVSHRARALRAMRNYLKQPKTDHHG